MKHSVTEVKLQNGSKGLLVHIPDANVFTYDINFRAGEYLVDPEKWEIPHLMEHVLLGANELFPKAMDFHAEVEKYGAYSNASTSKYDITYDAECADFEWERILELMLVAISKPLFLESEFKSEYGNVREEMTSRANNHFRHLSLEMLKAIGLKYKTDKERLKLMKNVNLDDVKAHYKRSHFTNNMRFVVAGNITPARHEAIIRHFENIDMPKGKNRFKLPVEKPKKTKGPTYIYNRTVDNLFFYLDIHKNMRPSEEQEDNLDILDTYLTETYYSKIFGKARERGLVYGISSGSSSTEYSTNWWFGAQVSDENSRELMRLVVEEIDKLRRGEVSIEDVEAAKQYALGRYQLSAQTVRATSASYKDRYFFDDYIEQYDKYPARIKAINKTSMVEVANIMFEDEIWAFGSLGNSGKKLVNELYDEVNKLWAK